MRSFTSVIFNDWMETPARVNIKQPWQQVTSVTPRGLRLVCLKRSTVVGWCFGVPQRLIWTVGVLRYIGLSHLWDSSSGTASVRIRDVFSHYAVNTLEIQTCKCRNPLIANLFYVFFLWKLRSGWIVQTRHMLIPTTHESSHQNQRQLKVKDDSSSMSKNLQSLKTKRTSSVL